MKSTQILTAAESGNFAPPGPVRIWSFFGPLAGSIPAGRRLGLVLLLRLLRRLSLRPRRFHVHARYGFRHERLQLHVDARLNEGQPRRPMCERSFVVASILVLFMWERTCGFV